MISGGVARFWCDISDSAGVWCDTLCATLCSAIGVSIRNHGCATKGKNAKKQPTEFVWEEIGFWQGGPNLSGLVAGDSAICGRLAALILRLRPAGLRFEEFRSPVKRGGLGLRFSNRNGLRPAAI